MNFKKLLPNDFRDFLSILSFLGFAAIFFEFMLKRTFIADNLSALFLIIGGIGLMVIGKVFNIHKWATDGIQKNETTQLFAVVFGATSLIMGGILIFGFEIPISLYGLTGVLAIPPAFFILADYLVKAK